MVTKLGPSLRRVTLSLVLFSLCRLEFCSCNEEAACARESHAGQAAVESGPEEEAALVQGVVRHLAVKSLNRSEDEGKVWPFNVDIPELTNEVVTKEMLDGAAKGSKADVSKALDEVYKNVSKYQEATKAAADEIREISNMPVKKAEILAEVMRKISTVEEQTMLIVESFSRVAQALLNSSNSLSGVPLMALPDLVSNSTASVAMSFEKMEEDLMDLGHSYANLIIMMSHAFRNVSFVQAHRREDPAICGSVKVTFTESSACLENFKKSLALIDSTTQNVSSFVAKLPSETSLAHMKKRIIELMSQAQRVTDKIRTALPPSIHNFQDAVVNALDGKVCFTEKSAGFRSLSGLWSVALCAALMLMRLSAS